MAAIEPLDPGIAARSAEVVAPVVETLLAVAARAADPWPALRPLVGARDGPTILAALEAVVRLVAQGRPSPGRQLASFVAARIDAESSPLAAPESLAAVGSALRAATSGEGAAADPVDALFLHDEDLAVRAVAARVLDQPEAPASHATARAILADDAYGFLAPYLDYTRAGHLDLLHLAPTGPGSVAALDPLRRAAATCGEKVLREVIATLGWSRVALGVEADPRVAVRIGASMPFFVRPEEAPWLEACHDARRTGEFVVLVAHGGRPAPAR